MQIDLSTGLLIGTPSTSPVLFIPSPNFNARPIDLIELLVIHAISLPPGIYTGDEVIDFFCNKLDCSQHEYYTQIQHLKVSAHLFIRRNGQIIQFVPFSQRAWHAGESCFNGRTGCNDFSIGIEMEGAEFEIFENAQYASLISCTQIILNSYPAMATQNNIVGHQDISAGRKSDPGPFFDWVRYRAALSFG